MKRRSKQQAPPATPAPKGGFRHTDRADIPEEALNFREQKVLAALRGAEGPLTLRQLGRRCFPGVRAKPGTYESTRASGETVRHATGAAYRSAVNALRRLVAGGHARKVERGTYAAAARPRPGLSEPETPTEEIHHE